MKTTNSVVRPFFLKKKLGQHFLHDFGVIERIIESVAPKPCDNVIEIGPGAGALTTELLPLIHSLDVIEFDRDVIPRLKKNCDNLGSLCIHEADVLQVDFAQFKLPVRLVGNLPYNISTPLLFKIMDNINLVRDMHFMLQKEVAERMVALPGTKIYGRLSVMIQYYCTAKILFYVGSGAFSPAPKVDSAFVRLIPRHQYSIVAQDEKLLSEVVRVAFCHRRKTISNGLKKYLTVVQLQEIGIEPSMRPEQLHVDDFVRISNKLCMSSL